MFDLTEVGSPMISRVNNDVTLGLTNGKSPGTPPETNFFFSWLCAPPPPLTFSRSPLIIVPGQGTCLDLSLTVIQPNCVFLTGFRPTFKAMCFLSSVTVCLTCVSVLVVRGSILVFCHVLPGIITLYVHIKLR